MTPRAGLVAALAAGIVVATPFAAGPVAAGTIAATGGGGQCLMTRTGEYPRTDADQVRLDPETLGAALDYASAHGAETIKVFRHSCLVGEGRVDPLFDRAPRQNWSQTKTVVALLTGIAQRLGYVDIDSSIGRYLPEGLCDNAHRAVTIKNLLQMSAGHRMS
ncbi:MAG TPA: hypothetical protein VHU88_16980 [Sporichthyaceae bacterium]|jgi:CubicO group peptidase (beta-lactamase class C family)|nr:hypothetical protein [Sporichthyaceae bacterium]